MSLADPYGPELRYKAVPIVWWLGAIIVQWLMMFLLEALFSQKVAWVQHVSFALVTVWVFYFTWPRGMKDAHWGWKAFTVLTLLINLGAMSISIS